MKSQLEDDLKAATSHQKRERIQQKLERVDWEAQYYKRLVDRWEEVANRYGEELKQLESTIKEEGLFCVEWCIIMSMSSVSCESMIQHGW